MQVSSSFVDRPCDPIAMDAARTISMFTKKWTNDEDSPVCLGNDIKNPQFKGSGKLYCGSAVAGSRDHKCGPSFGPQCASCARLTESNMGKELLPRLAWINHEGRSLCLGNDIAFEGYKGSDKFYCGGPISEGGSDGFCGPCAGPQCASCKQFTDSAASLGRREWVIFINEYYS
jgi:hypothetical protein